MNEEVHGAHEPTSRELKAALRPPVGDIDWDRLHGRIMAAAAARRAGGTPSKRASDWVAAWSRRGIPIAATALAAALGTLLIIPVERRAAEPQPPGFWPVAEALLSDLPDETQSLLRAGDDVESLLRAVMVAGGEERDIS